MSFKENDRISHPTFGIGTVTEIVSEETIEVRFDHGGKKRLSLKHARLSPVTIEQEAQLMSENERSFKETFESPDAYDAHAHGDHWIPFLEDLNQLRELLPDALKRSSHIHCWADNARSGSNSFSLPADEPKGTIVSPGQRLGMMMVIRLSETDRFNEVISAYPFVCEGIEHMIQLKKVYPWHNKLEAHIEADLGEMSITFFDILYARNKYFYRASKDYSFIFSGIAYVCEVIEPQPIAIDNPEIIRLLREDMKDPNDSSPVNIQTKGMAVFLQAEGDRDDYQFQAPVKDIREIKFLDKKAWQIRATVARRLEGINPDIDLDIYVTEKTLVGNKVPKVGDDIAGTLWLQGYLWHPIPFPL